MITLFVNTVPHTSGDGTTNGTGNGGTNSFVSLDACLASLGTGTLTDAYTIYCEGTAADVNVTQKSFITTPTNNILITTTPANRHNGTYSTSKYRIECTNVYGYYNNIPSHIHIDGLQIFVTANDGNSYFCLKMANANQTVATIDCRASNCILKAAVSGVGTGVVGMVDGLPAGSGTSKWWNNILIGQTQGFESIFASSSVYNCTSAGATYGFVADAVCTVVNSIATGFVNAGFVGTWTAGSDYNSSTDGTAPGAHSNSTTPTFVNAGAGDYHLAAGDTACIGKGLTDPGSGLFSDDIDGQTRSIPWSISADQPALPPVSEMGQLVWSGNVMIGRRYI